MTTEQIKQIEKEAKTYGEKTWKDSGETETSVLTFTGRALMTLSEQDYIAGASAYADKAEKLVGALKKIDAISFHKNEWAEMAEIGEIAKQALTQFKE